MPIFTTQLGTVEALAPQEAVKKIANYIRSLQETLEYRLSTLDSSNISELDAAHTGIYIDGKDITGIVGSLDSNYAELEIVAEGIAMEVSRVSDDLEKNYATIEMTDASIEYAVSQSKTYTDGQIKTFGTTVTTEIDGVKTQISTVEGKVTTISKTLEGLTVETESGTTKIKGGSIETDTLYVKAANIEGELTATKLTGDVINITNAAGTLYATIETYSNGGLQIVSGNGNYFILSATSSSLAAAIGGTLTVDRLYETESGTTMSALAMRILTLEKMLGVA